MLSIGETVTAAEESYLLLLRHGLNDAAGVLRDNIDEFRIECEGCVIVVSRAAGAATIMAALFAAA
jgi:hypothetical protein